MLYEIKRTVIETYLVEAISKKEALSSGFNDPIKISVVKETIKKVLNEGILESEKSVCDHPESARMHMIDEDDECTICGEKF